MTLSFSENDPVFLRGNVQVEPLIDSWYAWSHLVPPATAARNITERHLKIMDSYINAPRIHANAVKDPKMLGGPFIDYDRQRVDEIKSLRENTKKKRHQLIYLSEAIAQLNNMLRGGVAGFGLHTLYAKVPEILRGYVELVYDLNHHASFRIVEWLLYGSTLYDRSAQSLMLSLVKGDDRPFVFSTPRLEDEGSVQIPVPFESEAVDELFRLKATSRPWGRVVDLLGVAPSQTLGSFFTTDRPPKYERYTGRGIRWRYFGHACVLVESETACILVDPVLSYTYETNFSRYTYDDLPEHIDYVLITHNHQDHLLFETLLQIRHRVGCFVVPKGGGGALQDPSMGLILKNIGCKNVVEVSEFDELSIGRGNGRITAVPFFGEHADLDIRSKAAYLVRFGKSSVLFAADSCNVEPRLYDHVHREIGDVDVLFLGMECEGAPLSWLYGPLTISKIDRGMDQSRRLNGSNCAQAIQIVNRFNCKTVYVYAMGLEPWLKFMVSLQYTDESLPIVESNKLIQHCRERGIWAERLFGEKEILIDHAVESAA
jgi:L-ascorbate metabolism protein UlaG (beta-lactamase superfamily)